jgi:hypothetical protein
MINYIVLLLPALRTVWSEEELTFIRNHFSTWNKPPTFPELKTAQQILPALQKRTLPQIKTRVWAMLSKGSQCKD